MGSSVQVNSAVDSNKDKATYSPVTGAELVEETIADPSKRFAVFRFTPDRSQIVPTVTGEATMSWNGDWRAFTAAFPEDDVACGVYGFPYWVDEDNYDVKQILFTGLHKASTHVSSLALVTSLEVSQSTLPSRP